MRSTSGRSRSASTSSIAASASPRRISAVIFEEFRQVDGTLNRQYGGTGLGLSLVKQVRRAAGRHARRSTSEVGEGSTFTFTLPIHFAGTTIPSPIINAGRHGDPARRARAGRRGRRPSPTRRSRRYLQAAGVRSDPRAQRGRSAAAGAHDQAGGHHARPRAARRAGDGTCCAR